MNKGTCTGTSGMPVQNQSCIYEHGEPLFDIFLTIPPESREMCAGRKISANINLENYGKIELLDAFMTYWIVDENNKLVSELKDTRSVSNGINFNVSMKIPGSTISGTYKLYAQITYSGNKTAAAGESFEILDGESCKIVFDISSYLPFIIIGAGFFLIFIITIIIIERLHHRGHRPKIREIVKRIYIKPRPERLGFFERRQLDRERREIDMEKRRMLKEALRQKRIAEKRSYLLKERIRKEEIRKSELKEKLQKEIEKKKIEDEEKRQKDKLERRKQEEREKIQPAKVKRIILRPKPERIGFFRRLKINRKRRKKERESRRLLRELAIKKRRAERENRRLRRIRQKEHRKHLKLQKKKQIQLEKEYRRNVRREKRTERKGHMTVPEPVKKPGKTEKTEKPAKKTEKAGKEKEKPVSLAEDLMKQREV